MTPPPRDQLHELGAGQDSMTIVSALQGIASHERVSGVAVRCLELLNDNDEEIRGWAAECLSGSVYPLEQESSGLFEFIRRAVARTRTNPAEEVRRRLADQLFWGVTLIGRLSIEGEVDPRSLRPVLDEVIELSQSIASDDGETYAEAIVRAERLRRQLR